MKRNLFSPTVCLGLVIHGVMYAKMYPLRGQYKVENTIETTSSYEDVWNKVINFFASNNIAISTIDKSSGIVAANDVVFGRHALQWKIKGV